MRLRLSLRKLVRALSRERGKDMASDYARAPEPAPPAPRRNPFTGLKLGAAPAVAPSRSPLDKAVERYARSVADIVRMRGHGLTELPHQTAAFTEAGRALNQLRPDGARDLRAAANADRSLIDQAASGKTAAAIRAMALETEIRIDTSQRADRFVAEWQQKTRTLERLNRVGDYDQIDRAREDLTGMGKSLHRDPQLESLLRNRRIQLGITMPQGHSLSHDLQEIPPLARSKA